LGENIRLLDHKTVVLTLKIGLAFEGENIEVGLKEEI